MTRHADGVTGQEASDGRSRALLANVADMVTISDRDGRCLYASPATERVSGYTPEEFMAGTPFDSIHPEDRPRCEEALARLANNPGLSLELEHRVRHKNGDVRWVEGTFTSLFDDPDVGGLLATVRDITERKRAEEQLRRAGETDAFRVALGDALAPLIDPIEIQAEAARVLGEHLGANRIMYAEVENDEDGNPAHAVIVRCYASGVDPLTGRFRMADFGLGRTTVLSAEPVVVTGVMADPDLTAEEKARYAAVGIGAWVGVPLVKGGRFVAALSVHQSVPRDWTPQEVALVEETAQRTWAAVERARAEQASRELEERFRATFEQANVGIVQTTLEGRILVPNPGFCKIVGYSEEEAKRLTVRDITYPDDYDADMEQAARVTAGKIPGYTIEKRYVRKGGETVWVQLTSTLVRDASGEPYDALAIVEDITERKRLETERARVKTRAAAMRAETAERERISRELHDRVAHSMGVAYQSLQLHRALSENAPERAREKLAIAEATTKSALDQTRNLAIELRRSVAQETENGVATALRMLLDNSVPDGVDAHFSFSGDESLLPPDLGAEVYLVLREAIRNALKHSGCHELEASLEIHPGEVVGTVTDDGDGFDPEAAPDDGHHAGLGLESMRERAEMMEGKLILTSQPGDGTMMVLRIPLER